jgi:prepilin-type N-terminal cleavage/methylation domain-containing protein
VVRRITPRLSFAWRRAVTLVEVLIASAIIAVLGICLLNLMRGAERSTARAGELQLASIMACRIMDRLLGSGFESLDAEGYKGTSGDLNLASLGSQSEAASPTDGTTNAQMGLLEDGFAFNGKYSLEPIQPGMVKLSVTLTWRRYGLNVPQDGANMTIVRYVTDPKAFVTTR